ncbi:MAG: hydroxyacid dehydrogenase [Calditrichae bacterium]|nr:hydroxyacid dehydrogenase [Calditrichota bacterium]MCB9059003.1 hydroxyacid dehydrogenase [Calditrichia bacterium]
MYKILLCDPISESAMQVLRDAPDVSFTEAYGLSENELIKTVLTYNAIIVRSATKLTANIIDKAENLKAIGRAGTGLDNIDIDFAQKKGIRVFNTPGTNAPAVAEMTIAFLFALGRKIPSANIKMKNGEWTKKEYTGIELNDKNLGIIGCGTIGKLVAKKASALGMNILVYNRSEIRNADFKFEQVSKEKLLQQSDFVSLHLSKSSETHNIINKDDLNKMKKGAYLINTARGGMINENDLMDALNSSQIAGAALDVFDNEPKFNKDLATHPNVIATPHIAAATNESQERVGIQIVDQVLEYLRSKYIFL